jgi:hypothetical protein
VSRPAYDVLLRQHVPASEPGIVLTDARGNDVGRLTKRSPCPHCAAPPTRRTESAGFGRHRPVICGACGFEFPPEALV